MIVVLFAVIGLLTGVAINVLADHLPERQRPQLPYCLQCGHAYGVAGWLGIGRQLWGKGHCPNCQVRERWRPPLVEAGTAVLFALLPFLVPETRNLIIYTLYCAILVLIIVIDLEHKLILNVVTYPATILAFLGSFILTNAHNNWKLALVGAVTGYLIFLVLYGLGRRLFGEGALGFGDVKLALLLGMMLGFHRIPFALGLAILLGGVISLLVLLIDRRVNRRTALPYGQYLAVAGIIMLIWGMDVYHWYVG